MRKIRQNTTRSQRGITLIEMLVVVTIIALFAALVGPKLFRNVDKAKRTQVHAQINSFMTALGSYKLDTGNFPTTEMGLHALRVKPEGVDQWAGPYLPQDAPAGSLGPSLSLQVPRRPWRRARHCFARRRRPARRRRERRRHC